METYLLRILADPAAQPTGDVVRGTVRHVTSGTERRFTSFEELRRILASAPERPTEQTGTPTGGRR